MRASSGDPSQRLCALTSRFIFNMHVTSFGPINLQQGSPQRDLSGLPSLQAESGSVAGSDRSLLIRRSNQRASCYLVLTTSVTPPSAAHTEQSRAGKGG